MLSTMLDSKIKEFIKKYIDEDIKKIILSSSKFPDIDIKLAVKIISARRKLNSKMYEWAERDDLLFANSLSIEQASSSITAKHKQKFCEGGVVLDLTGGLGVDSYHFSQNNRFVIYFERDRELFDSTSQNFITLGANNIIAVNLEVDSTNLKNYLKNSEILDGVSYANLIYIDPARRVKEGRRLLSIKDYEPDITQLKRSLLEISDRILVKLSPMSDIKSIVNECGNVTSVEVISVDNDCKEILLLIERGSSVKYMEVIVKAINYSKKRGVEELVFTPQEESAALSIFCENNLKRYLYEPNASILKSGAFKLTGSRYNLFKLAVNTHLYTGDEFIKNFPGRSFEIKEVADYNRNTIRNLSKIYPKANITTRNFPLSPSELKKKLRIEDGGDITFFGCSLSSGVKKLVICSQRS
ncbi:MAG: SAM-dependent methyltransferase [Bacteroidetes bacterium HGW-Bacteroidetes-8]|jgi:hypothetical protein|nr:MAG: SAM-dependent methyltransferase [Bacteroidetes bacterium HGW-Bacteroidetes-8]